MDFQKINSKNGGKVRLEIRNTIGKFIGRLSRRAHLFLTKELAEQNCDIAPGEIMFLMHLYNHSVARQDELSQTFNIDKGNITKSIKRLEARGFLYKVKDSQDRRAYNIYLTEKGQELKPVIFNVLDKLDALLSQNLSKEEYNQLLNLLKKI